MTGAVWAAVVSTFGSVVVGVGAWIASARKVRSETGRTDAETGSIVVRSALEVIEALRTRIDEIEETVTTLRVRITSLEESARTSEEKIRHLEAGVEILTGQVIDLGDHPRWPGPDTGVQT